MKNMKKKIMNFGLCLCLTLANVVAVQAGGALESFDITGTPPSPIPGHFLAKVIGIKWDARSIPVQYSMNTTLDPIPNPIPPSPPVLTLAQAQVALQASFDAWNELPTSFIEMNIKGTTRNPGLRGFDFINELTFRTAGAFGAIASSPSVSLIMDATLEDGDRIDADADPDVSSAIDICADVDGDGDIEFPAGFYKAGTILDNDVQFNTKASNGFRFTVGDDMVDNITRSVDLTAVATHEFGHSHGLSHSMDNQISATNGGGATMFPAIDTGDPADERSQRTLSADDIAWSSFFYPEGSASSGPAALQAGDKDFDKVYGLIKGELRHGVLNQPVAGGSLSAYDLKTNSLVASGFSGTARLSFNPANGGLFFLPEVADGVVNGNYVIPVPLGLYAVGVEAVDGTPAGPGNISFTCQVGGFYGQQNFIEEFYNRSREDDHETRLGEKFPILVLPGITRSGIDIVTSDSRSINNFGTRDFIGFTLAPAGRLYAVQIPASQIAALNLGDDLLIQGVAFETFVVDASVAPVFANAILTTGTVSMNIATIDLARPLARKNGFLGQDSDFAPFYFDLPRVLGILVNKGIEKGAIQNLFIVLQIPTTAPFPGVSGLPPLIGLDGGVATNDAPIFGQSFISDDRGVNWTQVTNFNFRFSLVTSRR